METTKAEQLIRKLISNPDSGNDGVLGNDLLREFHRGYPLENLRELLLSADDQVVKTGVFIASELGAKATPLLGYVVTLLTHPLKVVRFDAIDSVLTCTTGINEREIAAVISMYDDAEGAVRWKVLDYLSRLSEAQLQGALRHFEKTAPDSDHVACIRWLTGDCGRNPNEILSFLRSEKALPRKYGVVGATRLAVLNREPLEFAASVQDEDVKQFASSMLKLTIATNKKLSAE